VSALRSRAADVTLSVLLGLALVQAALIAHRDGEPRAGTFALVGPGDSQGTLQAPQGAARAIEARVGAVGDFLTIEDLARGVLALEQGSLPGVEPLSASEKARLKPILEQAARDRDDLLSTEGQIAAKEAELGAKAREIALTLTPEQRAWVIAQRDAVSVGKVEQSYWDELLKTLDAQ
jgi:hypothetical protein